jgi:carboxymethylenebutenolidase
VRYPQRTLLALLLLLLGVPCAPAAQPVTFAADGRTLHGLLYRPEGRGPFPAVLYNHGSAPGRESDAAFEAVGPLFRAHGWVLFAPYRRGQGTSRNAGPYIGDEIAAARAQGGLDAAADRMLQLLTTDQLDDQLAARAWLERQSFVRAGAIAAMGNSFGGIESLLGAAHGGYCAAVDFSGGAESWEVAPRLRERLLDAARTARAPLLFVQAANDYTVEPSRVLYAAARSAGNGAEILIYAPFGATAADGHSFAWRGVSLWQEDVRRFLEQHCR